MKLDLPLPIIAALVMVGVLLVFVGLGILAGFGDVGGAWGSAAVLAGGGAVFGGIASGMYKADMKQQATLTLAGAILCLMLAGIFAATEL